MAGRLRSSRRLATLLVLGALGCEVLAGYNDVEPWPREAGAGGNSLRDANLADGTRDQEAEADASISDAPVEDAPTDRDAGPCPILTGNDACATVPHFTAARQVVDGIGDEFCDIPAMVFDVNSCPMHFPSGEPPSMPEKVYLRIAWSTDALHVHVHVVDPAVVVNPASNRLWDGDAIEIYVAGTSGDKLHGAYDSNRDGGAIQIVLTPPGAGWPARGAAFFNPSATDHSSADISSTNYAGRLVPDGYELELRYVWVASADPAIAGNRIAFDIAVGAQQIEDAGGRQLQCIISNIFVDGNLACGFPKGTPAQPYCDDRSWCQPKLLP